MDATVEIALIAGIPATISAVTGAMSVALGRKTHTIVNSQRTEMIDRITNLEGSLNLTRDEPAPDPKTVVTFKGNVKS